MTVDSMELDFVFAAVRSSERKVTAGGDSVEVHVGPPCDVSGVVKRDAA